MTERTGLDIGFWFPRPERGARLAEALRRRGHRVTIYHHLPVPGDQSWVRNVPYDLVGGLRLLKALPHQVFYTSRSFLPVAQLMLNRWLRGRPYVYTLNGAIWAYHSERRAAGIPAAVKDPALSLLLRLAVGGADGVIANSRFLADELRQKFPRYAGKVSTIYNGVAFDGLNGASALPEAWPTGLPRLLSVVTAQFGRKSDGLRMLIDTFCLVSQRYPEAVYVIAAKSRNPAAVAEAQCYLKRLNLSGRVVLDMNRQDVPGLLAAADLFMYATPPDSSDSLPRALLEAQAAGVPTVTSATTGCAEAVLDGQTGRAVPYDPSAIAAAAVDLLESGEESARMAEAGQRLVRQRFSWDGMAAAYERLFLKVGRAKEALPAEASR